MTYKQLRRESHNLLKSIPPSSQLLPSVAVPLHKKPSIFFGLEEKICHKLPRAIGRFHFWLRFVEFNMFFHMFFPIPGCSPKVSASNVPVFLFRPSQACSRGESGCILMHHLSSLKHHVLHLAASPWPISPMGG